MYKIFIIEDDRGIAQAIKTQAESWDLEAECCTDFHNVLREFAQFDPHLVLLDISLPFFDGYHWCNEIRKISKVPILFISSASDNMNIIMAMNMGADDFIAKPFDQKVLMAKIHAMLRRTYNFVQNVSVLEHRGALLNTSDHSLIYNQNKITLTKNEYFILRELMENKGCVVTREKLMELLWDTDSFIDENTLSVNIGRLRKKLQSFGLDHFISTKFGVGYIME